MKERPETTSEKAIVPRYKAILYLMTIGYHFRSFRLSYERSFLRRWAHMGGGISSGNER